MCSFHNLWTISADPLPYSPVSSLHSANCWSKSKNLGSAHMKHFVTWNESKHICSVVLHSLVSSLKAIWGNNEVYCYCNRGEFNERRRLKNWKHLRLKPSQPEIFTQQRWTLEEGMKIITNNLFFLLLLNSYRLVKHFTKHLLICSHACFE